MSSSLDVNFDPTCCIAFNSMNSVLHRISLDEELPKPVILRNYNNTTTVPLR